MSRPVFADRADRADPSAAALDRDPTPNPQSAVTAVTSSAGRRGREPFAYFAAPAPGALAIEAAVGDAYAQGRALYGDEDGDAWLAALEDGTHPLCRIATAGPSCLSAPPSPPSG